LGHIASVLAHGEGLTAHARAAEMRLQSNEADLGAEDLVLLNALKAQRITK